MHDVTKAAGRRERSTIEIGRPHVVIQQDIMTVAVFGSLEGGMRNPTNENTTHQSSSAADADVGH